MIWCYIGVVICVSLLVFYKYVTGVIAIFGQMLNSSTLRDLGVFASFFGERSI